MQSRSIGSLKIRWMNFNDKTQLETLMKSIILQLKLSHLTDAIVAVALWFGLSAGVVTAQSLHVQR